MSCSLQWNWNVSYVGLRVQFDLHVPGTCSEIVICTQFNWCEMWINIYIYIYMTLASVQLHIIVHRLFNLFWVVDLLPHLCRLINAFRNTIKNIIRTARNRLGKAVGLHASLVAFLWRMPVARWLALISGSSKSAMVKTELAFDVVGTSSCTPFSRRTLTYSVA